MALPPKIPLTIGTVSGPVFGIFDLTELNLQNICNLDLLKMIPTGLIDLSQIIMVMHPDQIKNHRCLNEKCNFTNVVSEETPDTDYICRAFFPSEGLYYLQWKEASISIGGSMLVARYLNNLKERKNKNWFFAFWSQKTCTWERLEISCDGNGLYCAKLHRKNFRPPDNLYKCAQRSMPTKESEEKAAELSTVLQAGIKKPDNMKASGFELAVFAEKSERAEPPDSNNQGSDRLSEVTNISNEQINLVPFLPIFVGEVQNVVPVGDFLRNFIFLENRSTILSTKPFSNLIENLRHFFNRTNARKQIFKYFGIVDNWRQEELFQDYPLNDSGCGWTFFNDRDPGDPLASIYPQEFLTFEPGTPVIAPFGNSASGALACAIAGNLLYNEKNGIAKKYRGKTNAADKPWGERFYGSSADSDGKYLSIWKGQDGLWTIRAHTRIFGQYKDISQL